MPARLRQGLAAAVMLSLTPLAYPDPGDATFRVDVELVTVPCVLVNKHGTVAVADVKREEFGVRDNGVERRVEYVWREADLPLNIAILVDVSSSQAMYAEQHRNMLADFLEYMVRPEDRAFVVTVGQKVKLLGDPTNVTAELRKQLQMIGPKQVEGAQLGPDCPLRQVAADGSMASSCGGSAIWNAVHAIATLRLNQLPGRRVILVLSDGLDTGSTHRLDEAVRAVQNTNAVVYAIKYPVDDLKNMTRGLERLSAETGGLQFPSEKTNAREVFAIIQNELRNQYVLGFRPERTGSANSFHRIQVILSRRDLKVRSRTGYFESAVN